MTNELRKVEERNITDSVLNRVNEMQLQGSIDFPNNYSVGNALKSAYLILKETKVKVKGVESPVLEECTKESISGALLDMVVQGLNPMKKQCYFIPYGNKLQLSRSYLGTIALTKRLPEVKDVKGYAIYSTDKLEFRFDFTTGKQVVKEFIPSINRKSNELVGALGLVIGNNEILHVEYMDMDQIQKSWQQGAMKGNSPAHKNFRDQMAIKTVINRACKTYVNTSDDFNEVARYINKSNADLELEQQIEQNANKKMLLENTSNEEVDEETGEIISEEEIKLTQEQQEMINKAPF